MQHGRPQVVFAFAVEGDRISGIELIGGPERIDRMELATT
jgi:hypothetical protein